MDVVRLWIAGVSVVWPSPTIWFVALCWPGIKKVAKPFWCCCPLRRRGWSSSCRIGRSPSTRFSEYQRCPPPVRWEIRCGAGRTAIAVSSVLWHNGARVLVFSISLASAEGSTEDQKAHASMTRTSALCSRWWHWGQDNLRMIMFHVQMWTAALTLWLGRSGSTFLRSEAALTFFFLSPLLTRCLNFNVQGRMNHKGEVSVFTLKQ